MTRGHHGSGGGVIPPPVLQVLTLSANSIAENSVAGTLVGAINNRTPGSTLSLSVDAGRRFAISGGNLVAGTTGTDYEAATSHNITVVETFAGATGSPKATNFTINVTDVADGGGLRAGVLTLTTTPGTNPPAYDGTYPDLQDGDTLELYYTTDGSVPVVGTPQASQVVDSRAETIVWGAAWPSPFPGGVTIKWFERYGRDPGTGMVWSPVTNMLSDAMPASGAVFVPGIAPAGQTSSSTTHTFASVAFGSGIPIVGVAAFFTNSVTLTPSGGGSPISLTLRADVDPSRRDATLWGHTTSIAPGNYDVAVGHSAANNDCSIHPGTLTGATAAPTGTFGQAAGVSSVSYAGAATVPANGVWIAVGHSYAAAPTMNWANGTPTKDSQIATTGSTGSLAHGTSSGTVTCTPTPGGFGAMAGATFGP